MIFPADGTTICHIAVISGRIAAMRRRFVDDSSPLRMLRLERRRQMTQETKQTVIWTAGIVGVLAIALILAYVFGVIPASTPAG